MSFKTWVGRTQKEALEHAIKAIHTVNSTFVPLSYYGFLYAVSSSCGANSCKYHIYTSGNGTPRLQKLGGLFSPLIMGKIAREYNAPFRVRPYGHYGPYDKTTVLHRWSSLLKTVQKMFISKRKKFMKRIRFYKHNYQHININVHRYKKHYLKWNCL